VNEGWHPDPDRAGTERWFDGVGWTEFRRHAIPGEGRRQAPRVVLSSRRDDATRWLGVMVSSPVWVGALYWLVSTASALLLRSMHPFERPLVKLSLLALMGVLLVGVALLDARELRARGFSSVPSGLWALGTPILYLRRRARYVEGADRIPLVIHLALLAMSCFGILLGISVGIGHLAI
jgi:hypothetical protein